MGEGDGDRVPSGGLPTTIVLRTVLSAIVERSWSRRYRSTSMASPIESNQGKVKDGRAHHLVLFGLWHMSCILT
jgi:hypothetical protein